MLPISVTLLVSKLDKSKLVRDSHVSNMLPILVTLLVLKFDKSKDVRPEHP